MRWELRILVLTTAVLFQHGCDRSSDYKEIALSDERFSSPLTIHFEHDGYDENEVLKKLHGVDPSHYEQMMAAGNYNRPILGNHPPYYPGCYEYYENSQTRPSDGTILGLGARIGSYQFANPKAIFNWALNHAALSVYVSDIRYPHLANNFYFERKTKTWYCPVVSEKFASGRYLSGFSSGPHHGIDLTIGTRRNVHWTYSNSYETEYPGKGKVKVFSGTFTYETIPTAPDILFGSDGSATIKMYMDPDSGKWAIVDFSMHEPSITLGNSQEPPHPLIFNR